ncbi:TIGR00366 family protein, partial [uncultured Psychrobacter sp.]|uniref:TIGR00366 family protein n=1 Tax=uncultured Psychrobacter sp. TaxID=259303 RepID=UPI00345A281A
MAGALINWGFGLVISAVFARSLAKKVTSVDYPLLVAAAYSGFLVWHSGLSGSIPLALSSGGDTLQQLSGNVLTEAIPLSQTIFAPYNLVILVTLIVVIPVLNSFMHPKNPTLVDPSILKGKVYQAPEHDTPAKKLDDSRLVALVLIVLAVMYYVNEFTNNGFSLGFNIVIGL